jgi:hypothetical protein
MNTFVLNNLRRLPALVALFALSMMLLSTASAQGTPHFTFAASPDRLDFTLHNNTGYQIDEVYVSPSNTDDWEEDILGEDVLENGSEVPITFNRQRQSFWDLKVVFKGGREGIWKKFNLSQLTDIFISFRNGQPWATTKNGG